MTEGEPEDYMENYRNLILLLIVDKLYHLKNLLRKSKDYLFLFYLISNFGKLERKHITMIALNEFRTEKDLKKDRTIYTKNMKQRRFLLE